MSRYVTKKHGLVIGSGNVFFHPDPTDTEGFRDYPCILTFNRYSFAQFNTLNVSLFPPAIQLLWTQRSFPAPSTRLFDRAWVQQAVPNAFFTKFLDTTCPGWGIAPQSIADPYPLDYTVFLAKRRHALAISALVDKHLQGISV